MNFVTANTKHNQLFIAGDFLFVCLIQIQGKHDNLVVEVL